MMHRFFNKDFYRALLIESVIHYASLPSEDAYIAINIALLILSLEMKYFVHRHVSIRGFINRVCLTVPVKCNLGYWPHQLKKKHINLNAK